MTTIRAVGLTSFRLPLEMLSSTELTDEDGKTRITLRWVPFYSTAEELQTFLKAFAWMEAGWGGTMSQLDACLTAVQSGQ